MFDINQTNNIGRLDLYKHKLEFKLIMDIVILAGGRGTRLSEETTKIPKPMIKIGKLPILHHIVNIFRDYKCNNFYILTGYKHNIIKNYFSSKKFNDVKINVINTRLNTETGGRINKIKNLIGRKNFLLTYGDGVSDININKLKKFFYKKKKLCTLTVVRPPARWGTVVIKRNRIVKFEEKNQENEGWINGGFMILSYKIFKLINFSSKTILEKDVLPLLARKNQLIAYKHKKFWHCMDNIRDKINLNKLYEKNQAPWIKKKF